MKQRQNQKLLLKKAQINSIVKILQKDNPEAEKKVFSIILRPSEQQINFKDLEFISDITPENFFNKTITKGDKSFLEEIVFKFKKPTKEKEKGKKKSLSNNI